MANTQANTALGLFFAFYAIFLLILIAFLSHYPWPQEVPTYDDAGTKIHSRIRYTPPPNFKSITDVKTRKQAFFDYLRPLIKDNNLSIKNKRERLLILKNKYQAKQTLTKKETALIQQWAKQYKLTSTEVDQQLIRLEHRINVIPEALVLAQAAKESAWGTSRFARQANNYFGQWCFSSGCGIIPKHRAPGAKHEIAKFKTVAASVNAYFTNLNTFHAYKDFRKIRYALAQNNAEITAKKLLPGLIKYSERGQAYTKEISALIRQNNLE